MLYYLYPKQVNNDKNLAMELFAEVLVKTAELELLKE